MILVLLVFFIVLLAILLVVGIGIAFLLHWLLPAVGLEMALLIGVIVTGQAMLMFGRVLAIQHPELLGEETGQDDAIYIVNREPILPRRRRKRT